MNKNLKDQLIGVVGALIVIVIILVILNLIKGNTSNIDNKKENKNPVKEEEIYDDTPVEDDTIIGESKYKIFNTASNKRPYAISVNNTPVAVKVQEGLNKAYLVYEFPTEGYTSRLMALFKDINDVKVGTIRSCRHNFMDYAHESDAILVCFGWSHYAADELNKGGTDFLNGNESKWKSAFWRDNPEGLAREHTAYTSLPRLIKYTTNKNYRLTTEDAQLLNYTNKEVKLDNKAKVKKATYVKLPYGNITTVFKYDKNTKEYIKNVNGKQIKDHKTKEKITTKNIIIVKINHKMCDDHYYWDLKTTGSGNGWYITNGKAVPIKWSKKSRNAKSKYTYLDGTEIELNDGRTYIEVHSNKKKEIIK